MGEYHNCLDPSLLPEIWFNYSVGIACDILIRVCMNFLYTEDIFSNKNMNKDCISLWNTNVKILQEKHANWEFADKIWPIREDLEDLYMLDTGNDYKDITSYQAWLDYFKSLQSRSKGPNLDEWASKTNQYP
jgi:hypothetical protein